eukprot:TRINITY_DN4405_c1_g2_i1.p1 TRINITY_DN4405_c1_g2~~TRINITY_DN4405_c1_g2_i1.p1  ORF type:complete len:585 (+),score=160.39 TRINITY_DN4405_c1_g2_i1:183-1757(+)
MKAKVNGGQRNWTYECDVEVDRDGDAAAALRPSLSTGAIRGHTGMHHAIHVGLFDDEEEHVPFAFVEASWFQSMTGAVIMLNCLVIGLETDNRDARLLWYWVEQSLLTYFVVELILRLCFHGINFFSTDNLAGNLLDLTIVMTGVVDMWLSPLRRWLMKDHTMTESEEIKLIIGMSRMLRVVRLVRLVRMVPPLYILAKGIMEAVQGMFWVLVFLFFILYAVSILCTRLIGRGQLMPMGMSEEAQDVTHLFSHIGASMFVLFEVLSGWSLMVFVPLFEKHEILRVLAVLFYVITAWALLAVMTGVVNEKILAVKVDLEGDERKRAEERLARATECLHELFTKADADGSFAIDREEFNAMLSHPDTEKTLRMYTSVTTSDLSDLFDWMDQNNDGDLSMEEFLFGFYWLNEEMGPKSFLKLQQQVHKKIMRMKNKLCNQVQQSFDRFFTAVRDPLHKVCVITEQIQRIDVSLHQRAAQLKEAAQGKITRDQLAVLERNLQAKLDVFEQAVERMEMLAERGLIEVVE